MISPYKVCIDAYLECEQLYVGIFVPDATLNGSHGLFWAYRLAPDPVTNIEVKRQVFDGIRDHFTRGLLYTHIIV